MTKDLEYYKKQEKVFERRINLLKKEVDKLTLDKNELKQQLSMRVVGVTLPSIESHEFECYLNENGFKQGTKETRVRDNKIYFLETIYQHYCNTIEFGN